MITFGNLFGSSKAPRIIGARFVCWRQESTTDDTLRIHSYFENKRANCSQCIVLYNPELPLNIASSENEKAWSDVAGKIWTVWCYFILIRMFSLSKFFTVLTFIADTFSIVFCSL